MIRCRGLRISGKSQHLNSKTLQRTNGRGAHRWGGNKDKDRLTRIRKCVMKDGVLTINGKDYVFHKASGEYEW